VLVCVNNIFFPKKLYTDVIRIEETVRMRAELKKGISALE